LAPLPFAAIARQRFGVNAPQKVSHADRFHGSDDARTACTQVNVSGKDAFRNSPAAPRPIARAESRAAEIDQLCRPSH